MTDQTVQPEHGTSTVIAGGYTISCVLQGCGNQARNSQTLPAPVCWEIFYGVKVTGIDQFTGGSPFSLGVVGNAVTMDFGELKNI